MPLQMLRADLTRITADALVNTANPQPIYADGTDRAVYEAAGAEQLLRERQKIGVIAPGEVAVTPAFALHARYIIHTVGPKWCGGTENELETLSACYRHALEKADELHCESIAFPLISTGVYGFPKDKALQTAVSSISEFLLTHDMQVTLAVFDRASFVLSGRVFQDIESLIDENTVRQKCSTEYLSPRNMNRRRTEKTETECSASAPLPCAVSPLSANEACQFAPSAPVTAMKSMSLDELLRQKSENFHDCLFRLIDERGLKDSEVYARANLSRKLFSKIRCNVDYHPQKRTVVALAIALKLSLDETRDLLGKAEMAFSPSSPFDIIVTYFIVNQRYDIIREINPALFQYDLPLLGA